MKSKMWKSTFREIKQSFGRFMAIFAITALGVSLFSGLKVIQPAMVKTTDGYFEEKNLYNYRILSNLGFEQQELDYLTNQDDVLYAEGIVSFDMLCSKDNDSAKAMKIYQMPEQINGLELLYGRMPQTAEECIIDSAMYGEAVLGEKILLSEDNEEDDLDYFAVKEFTIVGIAQSSLYIQTERGNTSIGNGKIAGFLYVPKDAFDTEFYTEILVKFDENHKIYSDEYDAYMDEKEAVWEDLAQSAATNRYDRLMADAYEELNDGKKELEDAKIEFADGKAEGEAELADARKELADAYQELTDAEKEIADAKVELADGRATLEDNRKKLEDAEYELGYNRVMLERAQEELEDNKRLLEGKSSELSAGQKQLDAQKALMPAGITRPVVDGLKAEFTRLDGRIEEATANPAIIPEVYMDLGSFLASLMTYFPSEVSSGGAMSPLTYDELLTNYNAAKDNIKNLDTGLSQIEAYQAQLDDGRKQIKAAWRQIEEAEEEIENGFEEIEDGIKEWQKGMREFSKAEAELIDGEAELADAEVELADGWVEYYDGVEEYEEGYQEFLTEIADAEEKIADAEVKIADAEAELADIEEPDSYILGRETNVGYACMENDSAIVNGIANVFPVFFYAVAALVCVTTMNRMIEEQRTQIGVLKALGYSEASIMGKYLFYSGSAAISGCLVGYFFGSWFFPYVIWIAYSTMYDVAEIQYVFDAGVLIFSLIVSILCSMGVTFISCKNELAEVAAELMRPKAPKAGKRIFLEYIPFIWKPMKFLHKVSYRNVFRYKRRFFMMVIGISGCTGLLVTGFGVQDSIANIANDQYDRIQVVDVNVMLSDEVDEQTDELIASISDGRVTDYIYVMEKSLDLVTDGAVKGLSLVAIDENDDISPYVILPDKETGENLSYPGDGECVLTDKLARTYDLQVGDQVVFRDDENHTMELTLTGIAENYLSNFVYLTTQTYEACLGEKAEIIGPVEVRDQMRKMMEKMMRRYKPEK